MTVIYTRLDIDGLGNLLVLSDCQVLTGLYFADKLHAPAIQSAWQEDAQLPLFVLFKTQVHEYLMGTRTTFTVPHRSVEGTPFQQKVWQALERVAYGTTMSYQALAVSLGCPKGTRAVATAVARNPLSLLIPCHRIIGSNGKLTGYAGGLDRKQKLLALERTSQSL